MRFHGVLIGVLALAGCADTMKNEGSLEVTLRSRTKSGVP
jgi:hypothetical protein